MRVKTEVFKTKIKSNNDYAWRNILCDSEIHMIRTICTNISFSLYTSACNIIRETKKCKMYVQLE